MTDEEGKVYVAGEDRSSDFFAEDPDEFDIFNEESSSSSLSVLTNGLSSSQSLADGDWGAKHVAFSRKFIASSTGGVTKNVKKNGKSCRFTWKFWKLFRECYEADLMYISNDYYYRGGFENNDADSKRDTKRFRLSNFYFGPIPVSLRFADGVCSTPEVYFTSSRDDRGNTLCVNADQF
jgi:hypothetical protein